MAPMSAMAGEAQPGAQYQVCTPSTILLPCSNPSILIKICLCLMLQLPSGGQSFKRTLL